MKQATLIIEKCTECPFIKHRADRANKGFGFYCEYTQKWIPEHVNILSAIWEDCTLLDTVDKREIK